ncbi:MAG TPA: LamG-like jellyroll fold domain-containing protein, partial [Verrucomicrobiae bacterium]|nr:LamG-like jellyroll fold domain-containing protein [Verrucomicrobiae bacterium]
EVSSTTGPAITDTNWHHIAVTYSGSTVDFYLDGNLADSVAHSVTFTFTTPAGIGCYADAKNQGFLGSLDEVSVYNRVLTSTEIQDIYLAGSAGKCFTPTPPEITQQPTNETVKIGGSASFSVSASSLLPLNYQWTFGATDIPDATNATLTLHNVQFTNAGTYAVTVSTPFTSTNSSNALLTVNDVLNSFAWAPIPSPQFVNAAFNVEIQALGTTNEVFTNFNGAVSLASTNGIPIAPVAANFTEGVWTGAVTISQPITNLVMLATNSAGPRGLADAINVLNKPALGYTLSGNYLLMFWPVSPSNFVLETSSTLSPPQWVPVGIPPLQIGDENLESLQMNGTNQYFLLQLNGN